jgi:glycosyltransferase involved in cell wall biosynthesis
VRIGLIHSFYRSEYPSGENLTVNAIIKLLRDMGHEVNEWSFYSDSVAFSRKAQIRQATNIIFSKKNQTAFDSWIKKQDVIQIHNYFPGITFANLRSLHNSNIKIHRVIHNYRKTCIQGNHFRLNKNCHKCSLTRRFPGIIRGCFNRNTIISAFVAKYSRNIESFESSANLDYIAISKIVSQYLEEIAIPQEKINIIPNSVPPAASISKSAKDCVFFGRIEVEKGILNLIEAWKLGPKLPNLHVVGNGTKLAEIRLLAKPLKNVIIHGAKYGDELEEILHISKVAIFPGLWREPFGRTLVESLARGHAIASSPNFSQLEAVTEGINGSSFELDSMSIIEAVMKCLNLDIATQIEKSQNSWERLFSPSSVSKVWQGIYPNELQE